MEDVLRKFSRFSSIQVYKLKIVCFWPYYTAFTHQAKEHDILKSFYKILSLFFPLSVFFATLAVRMIQDYMITLLALFRHYMIFTFYSITHTGVGCGGARLNTGIT